MLAALIATRTDTSTRYNRLCIGGSDVLGDYTAGATYYATPMETIRLTEEGPGGVSSLSFSVWDPNIEVVLQTSQDVEFWDIANGRPRFAGFIASFAIRPEGPHRWIDIECVGLEVLLDWMVVPNLTIPANSHFAAAIQSLVYNSTGIGWALRSTSHPTGSEDPQNSQEYPVAGYSSGFPETQYDVVIEGDSLRNAINTVVTACDTWVTGTGALATVDFYSGLRVFPTYFGTGAELGIITTYTPTDYNIPSVDMNTGGGNAPSSFSFNVDSSSVVRAVYVKGANPNATGLVSDGSGIPGPVAVISDDAAVTVATRNAIAQSYLAQFSQSIRGTLTYDDVPAALLSGTHRPGGTWFFLPNNQVFSALIGLTVYSIAKTFRPGGKETWSVAVGGFKGSAAKSLKRLTRAQRN